MVNLVFGVIIGILFILLCGAAISVNELNLKVKTLEDSLSGFEQSVQDNNKDFLEAFKICDQAIASLNTRLEELKSPQVIFPKGKKKGEEVKGN